MIEVSKYSTTKQAWTSTTSAMNCTNENHWFYYTGGNIPEGTKCCCGMKKMHYVKCECCGQTKAVLI